MSWNVNDPGSRVGSLFLWVFLCECGCSTKKDKGILFIDEIRERFRRCFERVEGLREALESKADNLPNLDFQE